VSGLGIYVFPEETTTYGERIAGNYTFDRVYVQFHEFPHKSKKYRLNKEGEPNYKLIVERGRECKKALDQAKLRRNQAQKLALIKEQENKKRLEDGAALRERLFTDALTKLSSLGFQVTYEADFNPEAVNVKLRVSRGDQTFRVVFGENEVHYELSITAPTGSIGAVLESGFNLVEALSKIENVLIR
jgi:hypothetical protein